MATTNLNPDTFTQIAVTGESVAQARGGIVRIAKDASPAADDWISLAVGDTIAVQDSFYASGVGSIVVLAV